MHYILKRLEAKPSLNHLSFFVLIICIICCIIRCVILLKTPLPFLFLFFQF